jgi:hypothetical protein
MVNGRIDGLGEEWVWLEGIFDHRWSMVRDQQILAKISKCRIFPTKLFNGQRLGIEKNRRRFHAAMKDHISSMVSGHGST